MSEHFAATDKLEYHEQISVVLHETTDNDATTATNTTTGSLLLLVQIVV